MLNKPKSYDLQAIIDISPIMENSLFSNDLTESIFEPKIFLIQNIPSARNIFIQNKKAMISDPKVKFSSKMIWIYSHQQKSPNNTKIITKNKLQKNKIRKSEENNLNNYRNETKHLE